ncbi:sporulation protein YqfD [Carboxydocella sp. JDF658]|uniref:sporulation protein YqfD n=1 Tax=Carboxydocella sp. JDF658 TaxID=1926600 RepID=UPI0009ACEDD1|nr:sporulation protein YqfD [Carboxydocella sp. JDF658]GAW32323.1 sporulation protein YqfD [Carboxydocella sp. JDF658]
MLVQRILAWLRGYVIIRIRGPRLERLLNMAVSRGIYLWDIVRLKDGSALAKVSLPGFLALRHLRRRLNLQLGIAARRGLPFWWSALKKRQMLLYGALLFVFVLYLGASFVWQVDVVGNKNLSREQLLRAAEAQGLKPGVWKKQLPLERLEKQLLLQFPQLAWLEIDFEGTRALIRVAEKKLPPEKEVAIEGPASLVANKEGVICEILVFSGEGRVKEGDTVKPGDILIDGVLTPPVPTTPDSPPPEPKKVQAQGIVRARVWYEAIVETERELSWQEPGEVIGRKVIVNLRGHSYTLWQWENNRSSGPRVTAEKRRNPLPGVELITVEQKQLLTRHKQLTAAEAETLVREKAWQQIASQLPAGAEVLQKSFTLLDSGNNSTVKGRMIVETREPIGELRRIE